MTPADPLRPHPCADFFKIATICSSENRFLLGISTGMHSVGSGNPLV